MDLLSLLQLSNLNPDIEWTRDPDNLTEFYIVRESRVLLLVFISFLDEIHVSKQHSPRLHAEFLGISSGAVFFACVPGCQTDLGQH